MQVCFVIFMFLISTIFLPCCTAVKRLQATCCSFKNKKPAPGSFSLFEGLNTVQTQTTDNWRQTTGSPYVVGCPCGLLSLVPYQIINYRTIP